MTSGASVLETSSDLRRVGLKVSHAVVLLDREQGGLENVQREGISLYRVFTMTQLMQLLSEAGRVTDETVAMVKSFIKENSQITLPEKPNPAVSSKMLVSLY